MIEEHMAVEYDGQSKEDIIREHQVNRMNLNRAGIKYS